MPMAKLSSPMLTSKVMVAVFLVASMFVAVVWQESGTTSAAVAEAPASANADAYPADEDMSALMQAVVKVEKVDEDSSALLQGVVKVEKDMKVETVEKVEKVEKVDERLATYEKEIETLVKDSEAPVQTKPQKPQATPSHLSLIVSQSREQTVELLHRLGVKTGTGMAIVLVVLCVILMACVFVAIQVFNQHRTRSRLGANDKDVEETYTRMLAHSSGPPVTGNRVNVRTVSGSSLPAHEAFHRHDLAPPSGPLVLHDTRHMNPPSNASIGSQPRLSGQTHLTSNTSLVSQVIDHRQMVKPPPLCPTLVMPMSEALLGIQMYELAQLQQEGALNIVGVSGKPLLRAEVKMVGSVRTLEIGMPEANSIPRASIGPPWSGELQQRLGSRALEIRGMRGTFYGILEMRSSGACYVVKEGQTVLSIDGDADSLALSLKSSVGVQLASVSCSTEQFEGVDHVEIRVEPGVDTVLVVAVVLAVLLLSPFLPPAGDEELVNTVTVPRK